MKINSLIIFTFLAAIFTAQSAFSTCETQARNDLITFIEQIQRTTLGGAKVDLSDQQSNQLQITFTFRVEPMGTLEPIEFFEVTSNTQLRCLTEGVKLIRKEVQY